MREAQALEILFADEQQGGVRDRHHRGWIISSVEDGQFRNGATGSLDAKHLFAPARRTLKDADVSRCHDIQARTHFALAENDLAAGVAARDGALANERQFAFRETRE